MIKVHIVVDSNVLDIESDTATIDDVRPIIDEWFAEIGPPESAPGATQIAFKIGPVTEQK